LKLSELQKVHVLYFCDFFVLSQARFVHTFVLIKLLRMHGCDDVFPDSVGSHGVWQNNLLTLDVAPELRLLLILRDRLASHWLVDVNI
jgi:hypothetical protein